MHAVRRNGRMAWRWIGMTAATGMDDVPVPAGRNNDLPVNSFPSCRRRPASMTSFVATDIYGFTVSEPSFAGVYQRHLSADPCFVMFASSWWRIAEPRSVAVLSDRIPRTSKVPLVTSAIFHHEGTKHTKNWVRARATRGVGLLADGYRPLSTDNAARTLQLGQVVDAGLTRLRRSVAHSCGLSILSATPAC